VADGTLSVSARVPVGATAVLDLPGAAPIDLAHGTWEASVPV